jgi:hypothetical protein
MSLNLALKFEQAPPPLPNGKYFYTRYQILSLVQISRLKMMDLASGQKKVHLFDSV